MIYHLSLLAGSSTIIKPLIKGSRDYFRLRHLTRISPASAAVTGMISKPEPEQPALWRDYDATPSKGEVFGWRDYCVPLDGFTTTPPKPVFTPVNHGFPTYLPLDHPTRNLKLTDGATSQASPFDSLLQRELKALLAARKHQEQEINYLGRHSASADSPSHIQQAVKESWRNSGLVVSPFRLRGLGRLQ